MTTTAAFISQKGGSGKSALALSAAFELMARKKGVALIDTDPQRTCADAITQAIQEGRAAPELYAMSARELADFVETRRDFVLIDTPGRSGDEMRMALVSADVAFIPVRPAGFDAWALEETLEVVEAATRKNRALRYALIINQGRSTTHDERMSKEIRKLGHPCLRARMPMRTAFTAACSVGWGITQYAPMGAAAKEFRAVVDDMLRFAAKGQQ